jgi:hypothetical protein
MRTQRGQTTRRMDAARRSASTVIGVAVVSVLLLVPRTAFACPVCFGQSDSPLALGINYGILAMLGFVVSLWVAFGSFFIYLRRRARLAETGALPAGDAARRSGAGEPFETAAGQPVPHAHGGTI